MAGSKESSRGMQHGTLNVEAPTTARKGCFQLGQVRHGYTNDGFQGFPHGKVKVLGNFSEIGMGAGTEDTRDLRKGKAGAEKSGFELRVTQLRQRFEGGSHLQDSFAKDLLTKGRGANGAAQKREPLMSDRDVLRQRRHGSIFLLRYE